MVEKLAELLRVLENIHSNVNVLTKEDFNEQYDNLKDFQALIKELEKVISDFKKVNPNDGNKVEQYLLEFHRILTTFEWHFSEINDINTKILKNYKDRIAGNTKEI
ncbi:hypothetical protein QQ991_16135 [Weizmannia coagulans]|jgi:uncharacterized protein YicC (UPF0701 family)|uniref:Uncharacterized protein n=1 Tax=Heyndrickxia faecalis TaxID=2824910 RepID=A0ABV3NKY5_9BACI|nr:MULTISPECIES: hypothetical protein [Heyndrickxia]ATW82038.1 hypothetical protein CIW84_02975 [Heyndrickxia coagulans]KGB29473.1 hypothetical protein IE89_10645 [Heyndrickxia coagulans]KXT20460.1 hypothetical protein UZ35_09545 [Heyndrickxia coagulans]MBT2195473.1 hypothetical protein [Heyndrickxia coagulans]MBT2237689.1 hypothetical protein [Heyndrickxia coagulans]